MPLTWISKSVWLFAYLPFCIFVFGHETSWGQDDDAAKVLELSQALVESRRTGKPVLVYVFDSH